MDKIEKCLTNDGEMQVLSLQEPNICGYGIELLCKYQGKGYEKRVNGTKIGQVIYPCIYIHIGLDVEQESRETDAPYTCLDALLEG